MKVELTYFKPSGKYYSSGSYETTEPHMFLIFEEVAKLHHEGRLPELSFTHKPSEFLVLISVPDHPNDHPHMIVPPAKTLQAYEVPPLPEPPMRMTFSGNAVKTCSCYNGCKNWDCDKL